MYDILIKNGRVIDGSHTPWFYADIAIKDGLIVSIGKEVRGEAQNIIDAHGLVVSPGFIDAHSHSDFPFLINPKAESKIRMGVTTEVIGQCGTSAAPKAPEQKDFFGYDLSALGMDFQTMGDYFELLEAKGLAVNTVALFGHGTIRTQVVGLEDRPATVEELQTMKELVAQAMQDGALGMSTGLIYPPSCYAPLSELIELAKVVGEYQGIYATHMRNESSDLITAIQEAITIAREAKLPVQISHFKACNEANWGKVREGLKLIEQAREEGLDITLDQYPYIATSTSLKTLIPQWAHDGGKDAMRKRLLDPEIHARIYDEMDPNKNKYMSRYDWVLVSSCQKDENKCYEGKNLVEIGEIMGKDPIEACFELLLDEDFNPGMVRFAMCEEDVEYVMAHPLVMIGSDASCMATSGIMSTGKPHPRAYGTFARVLGKYVRERHIMPLETAIYKMTGYPACRFHLHRRGLLKEGFFADITIFNPDTIGDCATFVAPHQYATGIEFVIVNGQLTVANGQQFDVFAGKPLRHRG